MGHEDGHRGFAVRQGLGDLLRGQDVAAGSVQDHVDGLVGGGEPDGAQHRLGVFDGDAAGHRHAEDADDLLPVNQRDDARLALQLEAPDDLSARVGEPGGSEIHLLDDDDGERHEERRLGKAQQPLHP